MADPGRSRLQVGCLTGKLRLACRAGVALIAWGSMQCSGCHLLELVVAVLGGTNHINSSVTVIVVAPS